MHVTSIAPDIDYSKKARKLDLIVVDDKDNPSSLIPRGLEDEVTEVWTFVAGKVALTDV
jgi:hypothetical protein